MVGKYILLLFVPVTLCYDYSYNSIPLVILDAGVAVIAGDNCAGNHCNRGVRKKDPVSFGILFLNYYGHCF
jgi:hypothetical protein